MIRFHEPVPPVKVQTVVTLKILMMHVMMRGRVVPGGGRLARKSRWKELVTQVTEHIQKRHIQKKNGQRARMDRIEKDYQWYNTRLNHSFDWMKAKGSPGCGIGGAMMHKMNVFEDLLPVHKPMGPVEVSIVQQYSRHNSKCEVNPSILINVAVDPGPSGA